jgi:tRNA(Ile2) C34 agmatinyltransferase TiaS
MPTATPVLKARLLAHAETMIETLLAQRPAPETATLAEIEAVVLEARQTLEPALTQELVNESSTVISRTWPTCPTCGKKLQVKGKRSRRLVTQTGEIDVRRPYYHCRACATGVFPPR